MKLDQDIIQPILDSPEMPRYVEKLNQALEEEEKKRREFYDFIQPDMKAEFINGEIIVHSPAKDYHTQTVLNLTTLMSVFVKINKRGMVRPEKPLIRFTRNDYQPDISFWPPELAKKIKPSDHFYPIPKFIVEVLSKSTRGKDKGVKKDDYESHGVMEYWMIEPRPGKEYVEQYVFDEKSGTYELKTKLNSGEIASVAIPGFKIRVEAIFDEKKNLEMLAELMGGT